MRIYLPLSVLLLFWSCSTGPKAAGSEDAEEQITAQRQQAKEATVSPPNPIRLLRQSGDTLTDDPMAVGEVVEIGFYDETGNQIKTIRPPDLNPYTNIGHGFELQPPLAYSRGRYLESRQPVSKKALQAYLPAYLYDDIPSDWTTDTGIVFWDYGTFGPVGRKYIAINFWLEWNPVPEEVFSGNYAVTTAVILDERGEVFLQRQFDGILSDVIVSNNGQYLLMKYELYPASRTDTALYRKGVEIIRLSNNQTIWKDQTNLFYVDYSTRFIFPNYLLTTKRKRKAAEYRPTILDTENEILYSRVLTKEIFRGIRGIKNDSLYYITADDDTLFYGIRENFSVL